MPQRNGQNPVRSVKQFDHSAISFNDTSSHAKAGAGNLVCPACKTEVPPKPGFRPSSLKCPKCGASLGKK